MRYTFPRESVTVKTCPDCPARIATPIQFPAVLFDVNANDDEAVVPASLLMCWTSVSPTVVAAVVVALAVDDATLTLPAASFARTR